MFLLALQRSLYHTSLYRRLILVNKEKGARIQTTGPAIHKRLTTNQKEGDTLLKFIYGQFYNGKLAKRYCHAPTNVCPLYHKPDSCAHITGEYPDHEAIRINRHIAACQQVHAAIRKAAKSGRALHKTPT